MKALYNTHKQRFRTTMKMLSNTFHCPKMYQMICHMIILRTFTAHFPKQNKILTNFKKIPLLPPIKPKSKQIGTF